MATKSVTITHALNGKTPYKILKGQKPHLAGIQESGAAAYVKDINVGKLNTHTQKG
jgi:hypothetical protein